MIENRLLKLISEDNLDEAMNLTSKLYLHSGEVRILVSQKGRLKHIESFFTQGLASLEDYNIERNKIRLALISFVQELGDTLEKNDKIRKEIATFKKSENININQNHSGTGHNIGRDYIHGDKYSK